MVEVVIATWVLTIVAVGLFGAFSFGFATIRIAEEDLGADRIMVQKLETLRVYDWSKITSGYIPTNLIAASGTNGGPAYDVAIAIDPAPLMESYTNDLRQVTVSLSWNSGGLTRRRSMTTLVSRNGIQTYKP